MSASLSGNETQILLYDASVEEAVSQIQSLLLAGDYGISSRTVATLALQNDEEILGSIERQEGSAVFEKIKVLINSFLENNPGVSPDAIILNTRITKAKELASHAVLEDGSVLHNKSGIGALLASLCSHPVLGFLVLLLVLYFGLYQFVGMFGGGTLVGLIEEDLFGEIINPWMTNLFVSFAPEGSVIYELFVGEYGVWTLGVTYAIALILPIVFTFFLMFSILEDTGYLPRLALLVDRMFKKIGLNGRGVIPIVLGFGCDTMATLVTRILESKRERVIATFLLSLCIPCSAQLAVVTSLLASAAVVHYAGISIPTLLFAWGVIMAMVFLLSGYLAAKITPGRTAPFYMELPPLRFPSFHNVFVKTLARVQWYFLEVFPLFIIASVVIWAGRMEIGWVLLMAWMGFALGKRKGMLGRVIGSISGAVVGWLFMLLAQGKNLFEVAMLSLQPLVNLLTLPFEAAEVFLFGFFRRDYGAAGLDKMMSAHQVSPAQMLVIAVTITLFLPCVAQFLIVKKERGTGMAVGMLFFTLFFATLVGSMLALILSATGWFA